MLESVQKVLAGGNAGVVADEAHRIWHRELFAPRVTAGLLRPADLAGYRNDRVYIRRSMHIPSNGEAVRDLMPASMQSHFAQFLFLPTEKRCGTSCQPCSNCCAKKRSLPCASCSAILCVYIHPYMDGNGRMGRFLMNMMLAAGGYPWTVIPVEARNAYMAALEQASVDQNIVPFADFLARLVESGLKGESVPHISGDRDAG